MDPISIMVAAWLGQWATEKIAEVLLGGVTTPLKAGDLGKALKKCGEVADREVHLFYSCEPRFVPKILDRVFKELAVQELQKPLKNEGIPNVEYLVHAFKLALNDHPQIEGNIKEELIQPWLEVFVSAYFQRSQEYIKFQVAKADYFEQLANWFDDVKFAGISVPGQEVDKSAQLAHIFVMPDVVEDVRHLAGAAFEPEFFLEGMGNRQGDLFREQRLRSQSENRSGRKFLAQQLLSQIQSDRVVLLGAPGVGKTTLMSYLAVIIAQKHPEQLGLSRNTDWLPILIRMRDFARYPDLSILDYVKQFAEKTLSVKSLPVGFFEYWLEDGRALILLDGLDEVPEEVKRYDVVRQIENFLGQFHRNRAIITSRPAGYKRDFFKTEEFPHYQLQAFDDEKIEEFINRWYDSRVPDKAEAIRRKDSLRKALADNERIKLLAINPLLLTIIALIHRYQALLPRERYKLYDKAVETLLTSWDANKELSNRNTLQYLRLDDLQGLMESLAYWIHTQGGTGNNEGGTLIDKDELIEQLARDIKTLKQVQLREAKKEAKRFVEFIRERTGLLNEQGQDCYAFVHKTFQEYLTAQYIKELADNEDNFDLVLNHIRDHIHDQNWREVLLLLIAQQKQKKAARAIQTVLDCGSDYEKWLHRDLLFAGSCLAENPKNLNIADKGLSLRILERLVDLEVASSDRVGERVREQVLHIICHLNETEFAGQVLELLKARAGTIHLDRLLKYRVALGEENAVIATLLQRMEEEDSKVRRSAAIALGELGQSSEIVVNALLLSLDDEASIVRARAADALGRLGQGSEVVMNALLLRLDDRDSWVRSNAASALSRLGLSSETVMNALLLRLDDEASIVRGDAALALGKLGLSSEMVLNALLLLLEDQDADVRGKAVLALGDLGQGSENIVNTLLLLLDDRDSWLRGLAAFALGNLGQSSENIVNALLLLLDDRDSVVGGRAAQALSKLGQSSATVINTLFLRLEDEDYWQRYWAAKALGKLGKTSSNITPAVVQWLEQHQDSEYIGSGIDTLWDLLAAE